LAMAGVGAGVGADPRGAMSLGNMIGIYSITAFSRDEERDADDGGFKRATALGYSPNEASAIWETMVAENKADPGFSRSAFFSSHPGEEERALASSLLAGISLRVGSILPVTSGRAHREQREHRANQQDSPCNEPCRQERDYRADHEHVAPV